MSILGGSIAATWRIVLNLSRELLVQKVGLEAADVECSIV